MLRGVLVLGSGVAGSVSEAKTKNFAPTNRRVYSVSAQKAGDGITKQEFDSVLTKVEVFYAPVIKEQGGKLVLKRRWSDGTVNASAERSGSNYIVNMYGGLARHPIMTPDAFMLVACHETGHHIGGAPKIEDDWASNEGQSDYFGTLQCFKNAVAKEDNVAYMQDQEVDPIAKSGCAHSYSGEQDRALCERAAMAGFVLGNVLGDLGGTGTVDFAQPDSAVVDRTDDDHPAAQCRLDTYFAGALCDESATAELSDTDAKKGSCFEGDGRGYGVRPRCWFRPDDSARASRKASARVHY